jgi:adenine deaminase
MKIKGKIFDIHKKEIYNASLEIKNGIIESIEMSEANESVYIMPGLIDAHIHIESSMLTPGYFARAAVSRGTTAVVSDPHEIANVLGFDGIDFMLNDAKNTPLKFYFGAPSCVPATTFETSGASLGAEEIRVLLARTDIHFLSEMMNYPGVIYGDKELLSKIEAAKKSGKKIDGHAPGLMGKDLRKYTSFGIETDHECSTLEEAKEKIEAGMKILIREGSAARNLDALKGLFISNPDKVMLCSDDLHPEMLNKRHINKLISRLIKEGFDKYDVVKSATINPATHYGIKAGMLRIGDPADFIIVDSPEEMNILETWIDGDKVYSKGKVLFDTAGSETPNIFNCSEVSTDTIRLERRGRKIRVIEAIDGELITRELLWDTQDTESVEPDIKNDILKIVVKDRYKDAPPAIGFIKGFGLKSGAFAGSVAHDSHNIICVGTNDEDISGAINEVIRMKGGLTISDNGNIESLQLEVAGIMTAKPVEQLAQEYEALSEKVKKLGSKLSAPFMTLSFMALLVIPELKLSDKGLFDGRIFNFVTLFC